MPRLVRRVQHEQYNRKSDFERVSLSNDGHHDSVEFDFFLPKTDATVFARESNRHQFGQKILSTNDHSTRLRQVHCFGQFSHFTMESAGQLFAHSQIDDAAVCRVAVTNNFGRKTKFTCTFFNWPTNNLNG